MNACVFLLDVIYLTIQRVKNVQIFKSDRSHYVTIFCKIQGEGPA